MKSRELQLGMTQIDTNCFTGSTISRRDAFFARKGLLKKSQGLSHFQSTFWRYAGLVAGIHCRGEDLAFFPPRRFFSTTFVYICSENAVHIGGFYFVQLVIYKRRVPDFIALFAFNLLSNAR